MGVGAALPFPGAHQRQGCEGLGDRASRQLRDTFADSGFGPDDATVETSDGQNARIDQMVDSAWRKLRAEELRDFGDAIQDVVGKVVRHVAPASLRDPQSRERAMSGTTNGYVERTVG